MTVFFSATFLAAGLLSLQASDTLWTAVVVADRGVAVSRADTLEVNHSQAITDLLLQCPGVLVGDCGGYAGLKTVSLRGMGSPHTAIYIDGVRVGNVQSGQGDLGSPGLANFSAATVDYAQNSVSFVTARPSFTDGRRVGGQAAFSVGSFGTYLPSARVDWKISDNLTLSVNAEAVFSKGDFIYGDGLRRENNDISRINGGLDLFGTLKGGDWHVKVWCNGSDRGTPGPVSWPSGDRQRDGNAFAQTLVRKRFSGLYSLTASAKVAYDDIFYTSSWGDSRYRQAEAQVNSTHEFSVRRWLDVSVTADVYWDGLNSTACCQQRLGATAATAAFFHTGRFKADVVLQYDGVFDRGQDGWNCLSPSADVRYTAFRGFDISGFVRRAYRAPTFNELYYTGYGNPDLKPEDALLTDIGADWHGTLGQWRLKAGAEGFYNLLKDKITSAPTPGDPNVWRPYNIGRVRSAGVDVTAGFEWSDRVWLASFTARYSFQDAVDRTPDSAAYGQQTAYVARHSLYLNASAGVLGWSVQAAWNLRADRYDAAGRMPDWNTLDLYLAKAFDLGIAGVPILRLTFKNVTDNRYELVSGYPMPGFSVTGGVEYKF